MGDNKKYFLTKWGEEVSCLLCSKEILKEAYSVGVADIMGDNQRRLCVHCAIDYGELGKTRESKDEV